MTEFLHPRDHRADGSGYGRPAQHPNALWSEVGPGKPMGELLRRYWHPIAVSEQVTDLPRAVKILGEELVLFRDGKGRAGLVYPRCMHRGTTLLYGKVEERGIRCCYHGWLFDTEGRCLEQPCEPDAGHPLRDRFRQPWYPVEERYGLIFAYMGPPEKKPVLPRFDNLEDLAPDEKMFVNIGGRGSTGDNSLDIVPYSWLHMNDNIMDPFHVQVLHSTISGPQFAAQFALMPTVRFFPVEEGVCYSAVRKLDDGQEVDRISSWICPNIMSVPDIQLRPGKSNGIAWVVPVDDENYVQLFARKGKKDQPSPYDTPILMGGKRWGTMTEEEHQRFPGDYEAQAGQGRVSLHSEEHLATSDRGIVMQRRTLERQIEIVAKGGDPMGVSFDPANAVVTVRSGNFYKAAQAAE
jgi:phenylpropionate dioxygenase-like ring-hydroxylating dioxygenase large terminal subunit